MAIDFDFKYRLGDAQSLALFPLEDRAAGTYYAKLDLAGNSVLSTVLVETADPGATVVATYFDWTTGGEIGEANLLKTHNTLSSGLTTDKLLIGNTHDKAYLQLDVIGGSARCSVYATIVATSATELADSLVNENQIVQLLTDKAISIAAYDEDSGLWKFVRVDDEGRLVVSAVIDAKTTPTIANLSLPTANTEVSYTLPANTKEFCLQNRNAGLLKFAYNVGESSTFYKTIFPGGVLTEFNIDRASTTIYIQSPRPSQIVEIISWI